MSSDAPPSAADIPPEQPYLALLVRDEVRRALRRHVLNNTNPRTANYYSCSSNPGHA